MGDEKKTPGQALYEYRFPDDSVPWSALGPPARDEWEGMASFARKDTIARLTKDMEPITMTAETEAEWRRYAKQDAQVDEVHASRPPDAWTEIDALRAALVLAVKETAEAWKACRDTANAADEKIRGLKADYQELRVALKAEREAHAELKRIARDHLDALGSLADIFTDGKVPQDAAFRAGVIMYAGDLRSALESR